MKLIKNFKINLRQGYIFRELKKRKIDISEEDLTEKLKKIQNLIKSATVYDSLKPDVFRGSFDIGKSVCVSLIAVTLGKDVESLDKNEVVEVSLNDGLGVAQNFVLKLVQIESEEEHCELTEPFEIEPQKVFENQKILKTMDFSKISIKYEGNLMFPVNTKFYGVNWLLKKKKQ
jgi:hypothetical protein